MPELLFLGCGKIARSHSKTLKSIRGDIDRVYASRSAERAAAFSKELGGTGSYGSYEQAIAESEASVAFVCTPPDSHLELAVESLRHGKHVIVEKPPFFSLSDFDDAAEVARQRDRILVVAENYFYKPLAIVLRDLLSEQVVGEPRFVYINALKQQKTENWRDDPEVVGAGALFEGGIHWINLLANLGPGVESIRGFRPGQDDGLDRSSLSVIRYDNGMVASLAYSWEIPTLFQGLRISRIFGTAGSITFETNGLFVIVRGRKKRVILPGLSDISGYRAMLQDFTDSLFADRQPQFTTDLARLDMALLERAYATMPPSHGELS